MSRKKILVISPTPTHPPNAGNRIRILNMVRCLADHGHDVHFLYTDQEMGNVEKMVEYWGERFNRVDYEKPKPGKKDRLVKKLKKVFNKHHWYYSGVDAHYNLRLDAEIRRLKAVHRFDAVLVEYIFQSKAFLNFGVNTLKVIDTHDVMTDRHMLFLKEGKQPAWYSTTRWQEKKGISRSDVIIAIQEREKEHFHRLAPRKKVVTIGHIVHLKNSTSDAPRKKLLFVGSNNHSNYYGISDFIEKVFTNLRGAFPGLELIIAGNICAILPDGLDGIVKLGEVDELERVYELSDIVINPLTVGTGLKIKMIEAMGLSKIVISTGVGAEGIDGREKSYLPAESRDDYLNQLKRLFEDKIYYLSVCSNARELAETYNRQNTDRLAEIFD
jgi:glycosyltransferase involved in cell wall biosynthesis